MRLYEIDCLIDDFLSSNVDEETGEILNLEKLAELKVERDFAIENLGLQFKNLIAEETALKNEIESLTKRKDRISNKSESIKRYLATALNGENFNTPKLDIKHSRSTAVYVSDINFLSEEFKKYKEPTADKIAIKKAIKEGISVNGAEIITNINMSIK